VSETTDEILFSSEARDDARPPTPEATIARLRQRIRELTDELADERGEPRTGERVDISFAAGGAGETECFFTDIDSGLQITARGSGERDTRRRGLHLLRRCREDLDATADGRLHSSFCRCGSPKCMWSVRNLRALAANPQLRQMGRSRD
jgi:hypothetical protein